MQITQEEENIAAADVGVARSGFLPSINGSASHTSLSYQIVGVTSTVAPVVSTSPPYGLAGLIVGQTTEKILVPEVPNNFWTYSASVQETLFDFWRTLSRYREGKEVLANKKLDTARVRNLAALEFTQGLFRPPRSGEAGDRGAAEVERLEAHLQRRSEPLCFRRDHEERPSPGRGKAQGRHPEASHRARTFEPSGRRA